MITDLSSNLLHFTFDDGAFNSSRTNCETLSQQNATQPQYRAPPQRFTNKQTTNTLFQLKGVMPKLK